MMLRALTGESTKGGGQHAVEGIQLVKGKKAVGGGLGLGFRTPVGAKVDLRGQSMRDFLNTLTEFVPEASRL
jgi:large subunit ribosomal protein L5